MVWSRVQQLLKQRVGRRLRGVPQRTAETLELRSLLTAVTVQLDVLKDTTIYESSGAEAGNGAGSYLLVGGEAADELARRGLLAFDLANADIPQGATILDVTLTLHVSSAYGGAADIAVYRLQTDWGEGAADAPGNEIDGAPAQQFDATWLFSFFDGAAWTTPGGDFLAGASATANVAEPGTVQWVGEGLIQDVQHWLDNPAENFGWMLLGDFEPGSLKAFDSRDSTNAVLRPSLEVTYESPLLPALVEGRSWQDMNADGLRVPQSIFDLQLTYHQGRNLFNLYGGKEYWFRSALNQAWYFLTDSGALLRWSGQAYQLTGTLIEQLDTRFHANPGLLLQTPESVAEPWLNGTTFQLLDSTGAVVATTVSADRDLNQDGQINPELERGWYRFEVSTAGDYRVRAVAPAGLVESPSLTSQQAQQAYDLQTSLGLTFTGSLYENCGFRGERWLKASSGWVYITPAGDLYRWSGRSGTAASPVLGTWLAHLGPAYYRDVSLIYNARSPQFSVVQGTPAGAPSAGFYQPVTINGRAWQDVNGDGVRNPEEFGSAAQVSRPADAPAGNFQWYRVTVPQSPGAPAQDLYFYLSGTRLFHWSPQAGSTFYTEVWGGATGTPESTLQAAFCVESWLNGSTLQLLDERGYVVTQTQTANQDLNGDQQIDPVQESGWYAFTGLLPGRYTIREVQRAGWIGSSPAGTTAQQNQALSLQQQFGFKAASHDWYNFGARQERWFQGSQNQWFYIVPDGTVFRWDGNSGGARGAVQGTQLARLSAGYYVNISQLFQPQSSTVTAAQPVSTLNFGSLRVVDGLFANLQAELLKV